MIIPVCTLLTETSPQALPLGAACIVSSINEFFKNSQNKSFSSLDICSELVVFSAEENPSPEFVAKKILEFDTTITCFSVFVWNYIFFTQVAKIIRKENPNFIFVAGGPEITAHPESCLDFDFVISGEGEVQVPLLLKKIIIDKEKNLCRHVYGGRVPVEKLVSPYLSGILDTKNFADGALWELARGCPFKCAYCYESKGEKTVVHFPMERIKSELEYFKKQGVCQVFVLDPTYNANKQRALEILQYIKKTTSNIFFHFECRAEFIDKELARAFAEITCSLQIGLQSSNPKALKLVNRSFNKEEFVRKINLLNKAGVIFGFDLIYGLPGDNLQSFRESIDFALSLYPNSLEIFRLSVLPGTILFDNRKELELVAQNEPPYFVLKTRGFSSKDLSVAEKLGQAVTLFYSQGRAVSWFHSLLKPLKQRPWIFFERFYAFVEKSSFMAKRLKTKTLDCLDHQQIEKLQIDFIQEEYNMNNLKHFLPVALDIIKINGAFSRAYADGKITNLQLSFHPEDLLSPYAMDITFFAKNAKKYPCNIKVFPGKQGPVWKMK